MKKFLKSLVSFPVICVTLLTVLIGSIYLIERITGYHPTYYPGEKAKRKAKNDYPNCSAIKVVSKTPIDYKNDKYRNSVVVLSICGEESRYNCSLNPPIEHDAPATYDCYEAKVILEDFLKRKSTNQIKR